MSNEALRYDTGKQTWHHIHPEVLAAQFGPEVLTEPMVQWYYYGRIMSFYFEYKPDMFKVLDFGAKKYASLNYSLGMNYSRVFDSWFRHKYVYQLEGNPLDKESGISHKGHQECNELFAYTYSVLGYDRGKFDDRPFLAGKPNLSDIGGMT